MSALTAWRRSRSASLFERIEESKTTRSSDDTNDLVDSLKRNLQAILNTRSGNAQSCPELGIIDFNDATGSSVEVYSAICRAIKRCIEDYEPRISRAEIIAQPNEADPLTLYFLVRSYVSFEEHESIINFNLRIDGNHKYKLE
ncbi:type VI secretion system baseplate subunit TssE [Enterobacter asburiae]|jgi:type VI secretion system protein|uniref:type VI secretion system baseplate subunit TssE n=1 Tax=Enterobacter TaxID=547 RepID=UPI00135AB037|nr:MULTISPECIES: type VI secretion system baseplate subunit TssE [Enterobacter]EHN8923254.1 type VI secretion system baseplate subunit TssE [Enterobacter asburiae]ELH8610913.1 type VI secretion system baseplate subunit TssE [Enterobacter asburiae]EMD2764584.1 type VI secretion system baseplate subunit TssE [Enterobacter asburiae]MBW4209648.1 type VI secretion system baseplate subunit TssE [Enterobacter asburiae]HCT3170332.1 type VI secretion system baseplate subunit TssE [Enterobacter asburiae